MTTDSTRPTRDAAKPESYYDAFVAREKEAMEAYTRYDNPALFGSVAPKCMRIGFALYSAGNPVHETLDWFDRAATYRYRYIVEGQKSTLEGLGLVDDYLELFSAAYLAGRADDLVRAVRESTIIREDHPAVTGLLHQFFHFLTAVPVEPDESLVSELLVLRKQWAPLPRLFSAASTSNAPEAASALESYLLGHWRAAMEKESKRALKSPQPEYWGKWSALSAATIRILGAVPELSRKAAAYVPVELAHV